MSQIFILGDSNAYGCWDESGGWVDRLKQYYHKKIIQSNYSVDHTIYNLGVLGDTSNDVLERYKFEIGNRLSDYPNERIIIIAIGTNDSMLSVQGNKSFVDISEFENNLKKLIGGCKELTDKVYILDIPPVDESKTKPIPWFSDWSYTNDEVKKYNEVIYRLAGEASLIKINSELVKQNIQDVICDGVHLSSKGHEIVFEIVKDHLQI